MSEESKDPEPQNFPPTTYESAQELSKAELSEIWSNLPYQVQKSLNKQKKGKLPPVTDAQLAEIRTNFIGQSPR